MRNNFILFFTLIIDPQAYGEQPDGAYLDITHNEGGQLAGEALTLARWY